MNILDIFKKFFEKGVKSSLDTFTKAPKNPSSLIKTLAEQAKKISKVKLPKK